MYYSVNGPCFVGDQEGYNGKCNADDIIAIRALAFDIDFTVKKDPELVNTLLSFIDTQLIDVRRPSLVIDSGGGFQLIYLLNEVINIKLFRPAINLEQEDENEQIKINRDAITRLSHEFETLLRSQTPAELTKFIKIDNMSNVDRVMRLPGTVNYPKAEKRTKGQVEAQAHIAVDYHVKCDIYALRKSVPTCAVAPQAQSKRPYVQRPNDPWTVYAKAKFCCEFVRDRGDADTNEWYSLNLIFPLLGEVRDGNITLEQGEELFLEAVCGGERYEDHGRGMGYFRRQWRSHIHSSRNGKKHLGSLIELCKRNGMTTPWVRTVVWESDFDRQRQELAELRQIVGIEDMCYVKSKS